MTSPFRPAAGGAYFRKSEDDEPVLIERTGDENADGWAFGTRPTYVDPDAAPASIDIIVDPETEAPKGRRKGR